MRRSVSTYNASKYNRSNPHTTLSALLICLFCWVFGFVNSIGYPLESAPGDTFLWSFICRILQGKTAVYLTGLALVCAAAGLLQRANYILLFIKKKTMLPFLVFILLNSLNPAFSPVHPASVAIFFLFFAMLELFPSYQNPYEVRKMFNGTFYLAVGSLIWVHLLWAIPLFWIGMYIFRILDSRSFIASVLGVFTFYWMVLGWCIWNHDYSIFSTIRQNLTDINFVFADESFLIEGLGLLSMVVLTGIMAARIPYHDEFDNSLRSRHFLSFFSTSSIYSFLLLLFYKQEIASFLSVFYIPASSLIAYFFVSIYMRKRYVFLRYYLFLFFLLALFLIIHIE